MTSYETGDPQPPGNDGAPGDAGPAQPIEQASAPEPWYRNRWLLAVWATMVAILIGLIIYGIVQLSRGGAGGSSTTTPSTTPSHSSTPARSSTTTPPSTTETPPPPPSSSSSDEQPPPDDNGPPPAEPAPPAEPPHHHHHLPHIPSTITLPHTVITLPPGF
jgi:cytoskeletal protein RodZ